MNIVKVNRKLPEVAVKEIEKLIKESGSSIANSKERKDVK